MANQDLNLGNASFSAANIKATTFTGALTGNATTATNVAGTGITGTTLASNVVTSSLTAVGTIATGVWQGTVIDGTYINYNTTNLKVTTSQLNTIQDISTASSPSFKSIALGAVDAVYEGGQIDWVGAPTYDNWTQDVYINTMRFYTNSANTNSIDISNIGAGIVNLTLDGAITTGGLYTSGTYGGGSGDFTNVTTPQLKITATSGAIRIPHLSADAGISTVYNYQTGKDVYWGEPADTGIYYFRGRTLNIGNIAMGTVTAGTWNGTAIGGAYINYNTTNLKVTTSQLNTIQDIATTSTPTFVKLITPNSVGDKFIAWDNFGLGLNSNNLNLFFPSTAAFSLRDSSYSGTEFFKINSSGAITTGTWQGTAIGTAYGGTGASTFTLGSVVFAGTSGVYTQDNANFFWDDTNNRLGINTATPATAFQVGAKVSDDGSVAYTTSAGMFVNQTPTASATLNDPKSVLYLTRQGTGGQAYGAKAVFQLSRYENVSVNSRTRLDITLANASFDEVSVMQLYSSGNVAVLGTLTAATSIKCNRASSTVGGSLILQAGTVGGYSDWTAYTYGGIFHVSSTDSGSISFMVMNNGSGTAQIDVFGGIYSHSGICEFVTVIVDETLTVQNKRVILETPGLAQGEQSNLTFYATFTGTADNGRRRAGDIFTYFSGGAWGYQYMQLCVGNGTSSNDAAAATLPILTLDALGNVALNAGAIATSATSGFMYISTCAGTPTGTPKTFTGDCPMVYDTTNNKLYIYNGSWRSATFA